MRDVLRSIKSRLTVLYVAIFAVILVAFGASLYAITRQDVMADLESTLVRQARAFAEIHFRQDIESRLGAVKAVAAVYDDQGRARFRSKELRGMRDLDFDRLDRETFTHESWRFSVVRSADQVVAFGVLEARDPETVARQAQAFAEFCARPATYLSTVGGAAAVYDAEGVSVFRSKELRTVSKLDFSRLNREFFSEGSRRFCVTRARHGGADYTVVFGMDETAVRERLFRLLGYFALFVPIVLLISWYVGFVFVRASLAPVETIRARAERLSRENLAERLPLPRTRGEFRELAVTFNDMLARLDRAFSQTQQFTANASHELRTPLANLRTEIELALEKGATAEEYQRLLASVVEEVSRMTHIVENLLLLAQLDRGTAPLRRERVDISGVAREAVDALQIMGETRGVKVREGVVAPDVAVTGDAVMLRRVVMNLLENGVKYNREGGEVKCSVWRENGTARIEVADDGPGIPGEALPHLFERFFRVERAGARADGVGGTGLGLSICKSLVEAHGGRIDVRSREGVGTTFHVTLPVA